MQFIVLHRGITKIRKPADELVLNFLSSLHYLHFEIVQLLLCFNDQVENLPNLYTRGPEYRLFFYRFTLTLDLDA